MRTAVPAADRVAVAQSIAYDTSIFHEIESYWDFSPGMHNSAFSPEDLVSNFLGTYVGGRALAASGSFDSSATSEINALLASLGARSPSETAGALSLISGRGIQSLSLSDLRNNRYLSRRNFNLSPIVPWLVTGAPGCVTTPFPSAIPRSFPPAILAYYEVEFRVPAAAAGHVGTTLKSTAFAGAITTIKAHASSPMPPAGSGYGTTFETPW
jgi:hypothetical protein